MKYHQNGLPSLVKKQRHDKNVIRKCTNKLIQFVEGLHFKNSILSRKNIHVLLQKIMFSA